MRYKWIDFIKTLSIFLVLVLHTCDYGMGKVGEKSLWTYYVGVFAIPLFFMVSGYLQMGKTKDVGYCKKKIINIFLVALFWNAVVIMYNLLVNHVYESIIGNAIKSLMQLNSLGQLWFLGAMALIYMLLPIIQKVLSRNFVLFLVILCVIVNVANIISYQQGMPSVKNYIYQPFRLWTWLTYFCIGGYIRKEDITFTNKFLSIPATTILVIGVVAYEYYKVIDLYGNPYAENFYDSLAVIIATTLIFIIIKSFYKSDNKLVEVMGSLTLGVLIIHPVFVKGFKALYLPTNNYLNLEYAVLIFIICMCLSYLINKLPVVNRFIRI